MQKVKRNGQVTIPKEIREAVQLKDGDYVQTTITAEGILIKIIDGFNPQYRNLLPA